MPWNQRQLLTISTYIDKKAWLRIREIACLAAIISFGLILALPRYRTVIDISDEGSLVYGAMRVLDGQIPNRDFVSLQPPMSFYTIAAVFKLFGASLVTSRTLGLCIYIAIILLAYVITRLLTGAVLAFTASALTAVIGMPYFNFNPCAVWQGIAASLLTIFFILKSITLIQRRWAFPAGLTTALTVLSRQDQGFYLIMAVLIYAVIIKFAIHQKPCLNNLLGFWILGIASIIVPFTVYWTFSGTLPHILRQLVLFPMTTYAKTSSLPFPVFESGLLSQIILSIGLLYSSPIIGIVMAIWLTKLIIRRQFRTEHSPVLFILIVSLLFYCQFLIRSDIFHLIISLPPFFILLSISIQSLSGTFSRRWLSTGVKYALLTLIAFFLLRTKSIYLTDISENTQTIRLQRGGIKTTAPLADRIEHVVMRIQEYSSPGECILCLPYHPMLYFLSERNNPTRWNYIWPGDQTADEYNQLIEQADASRPAVVVLVRKENISDYAPAIVDYVNRKYKKIEDDNTIAIYIPASHIEKHIQSSPDLKR